MSAAPKYPSDLGYAGLRMTAEEFFGLGETRERYELIDGVVVMSPSPTPRHQKALLIVAGQAAAWAQAWPGAEVIPDVDVQLAVGLVYRPDIAVYSPGRLHGLPDRLEVPPDLVVELLSPGSKAADLITKRNDYERFGVHEYWVIDPADGRVRAWHRKGTVLVEGLVSGDLLASVSLKDFVLDLRPLRALVRPEN